MPIVKDKEKLHQALRLLGMMVLFGLTFYFVGLWFGLTAVVCLELFFIIQRMRRGTPELQIKLERLQKAWQQYKKNKQQRQGD